MKRLVLGLLAIIAISTIHAQDCQSIVLPHFNYDENALLECPQWKIDYFCAYSHAAFYFSDTIPSGAQLHSLNQVFHKQTGTPISDSIISNLDNLNYFAYTFDSLQYSYPHGNVVIYFPTSSAQHPYLVLRSIEEMMEIADHTYETIGQ